MSFIDKFLLNDQEQVVKSLLNTPKLGDITIPETGNY